MSRASQFALERAVEYGARHAIHGLAGPACARTPRIVRGGLGFLIGGAVGSVIGGILAARMVANTVTEAAASPASSFPFLDDVWSNLSGAKTALAAPGFPIGTFFGVGVGIPVALAALGAVIGAYKPTC